MRSLVSLAVVVALAITGASAGAAGTDADVSVSGLDLPTTVQMGATGTWTWIVTNNGPAPANGVEFATDRNTKVSIDSGRTDLGPCYSAAGNIVCEIGTLAVGQSVTVTAEYRAPSAGRTTLVVHTRSLADPDQTNNDFDHNLEIVAPAGGVAKVSVPSTVRIMKTGGVRLRLTPTVSGNFGVDGTVATPSGPIRLTHVDLRNIDARRTKSVWLGTTPAVLAQIGRALRGTPRLRARITVTDAGASVTRAVTLTR